MVGQMVGLVGWSYDLRDSLIFGWFVILLVDRLYFGSFSVDFQLVGRLFVVMLIVCFLVSLFVIS